MAGALLAILSITLQAAPAQIEVRGLFDKAVLLEIDGRQQFLRASLRDSSGLLLVSATPREAVIDLDGQCKNTDSERSDGRYLSRVVKNLGVFAQRQSQAIPHPRHH
jgi:hypothetical protein